MKQNWKWKIPLILLVRRTFYLNPLQRLILFKRNFFKHLFFTSVYIKPNECSKYMYFTYQENFVLTFKIVESFQCILRFLLSFSLILLGWQSRYTICLMSLYSLNEFFPPFMLEIWLIVSLQLLFWFLFLLLLLFLGCLLVFTRVVNQHILLFYHLLVFYHLIFLL